MLELVSYKLNDGLVKAIAQSINLTQDKIQTIHLSNNLLRDEQVHYLFSELSQDKKNKIRSIVITDQNEFGLKTSEVLNRDYLSKHPPYQLDELRIVNCKVYPGAMNNVLRQINELGQLCYLRKLSIPSCNLNQASTEYLSTIIQKMQLIELDISYNKLGVY